MRTAILLAGLLILSAGQAFARAELKTGLPAEGAEIAAPLTEVTLDFSEPVLTAFSFIAVLDEKGRRLDDGRIHVDPASPTRLHVVVLQKATGLIRVNWQVVSAERKTTKGTFTFLVKEGKAR